MKKCLFLFAAVLFSLGASAQFEIRPFLGANFTDVSRSPDGTSSQARLGGQIGTSLIIGNRFHLMPGIAYFSQNTEYSSTAPGTEASWDQRVNGVQIPILVGYRFVDASTDPFFNVRAFAGPTMQFLTRTRLAGGIASNEVDWSDNSWQAMFGLGFDIKFIFLDFGYSWGLTRTGRPGSGVEGWGNFRSNTFLINAGVRLNLAG